jgi:cellulose biosynthesis protein BcsQ
MSVPVLTFFNNKGGVGKTSLVFHLAWMLSEMGKKVVAIDLDPQANLTSAFLPDELLEEIWDPDTPVGRGTTIYQCVRPLLRVGDILPPQTQEIAPNLHLVPGDLALAGFEGPLSDEWSKALGDNEDLYRPFRILSSFWQVAQMAARQHGADIILADVGPNLGAINRSALIATDYVVVPLAADLFSLQGLRNLGPTLNGWRTEWDRRRDNWKQPDFDLPSGGMKPLGYVLMQHGERVDRPVKAYRNWAEKIPAAYRALVLDMPGSRGGLLSDYLAQVKHYRSLAPMAQEAHKPIFKLTAADGAIGSHAEAVRRVAEDFRSLAASILLRLDVLESPFGD